MACKATFPNSGSCPADRFIFSPSFHVASTLPRDVKFLRPADKSGNGTATEWATGQVGPAEELEIHIHSCFRVKGLTRADAVAMNNEHWQNALRHLRQIVERRGARNPAPQTTRLQMRFLSRAGLARPLIPPHPQTTPRAVAHPVQSQAANLGAYYSQQAQTMMLGGLPQLQHTLVPQNPYGAFPQAAPFWQQHPQVQAMRPQYQHYYQAPVSYIQYYGTF